MKFWRYLFLAALTAGVVSAIVLGATVRHEGGRAAAAASGGVAISMESGGVMPGATVILALNAHADPPGIGAYAIDVAFDPAVVHAESCDSDPGLCNKAAAPDRVRLAGISLDGLSGDAKIADIVFRAVGALGGHTSLEVHIVQLADPAGHDLKAQAQVTNGGVTVVQSVPSPTPAPVASGDVNCDGHVNSLDGLAVLNFEAGLSHPGCLAQADVDCSGAVDSLDALDILRFVASLPVQLPPSCPPLGSPP